jgi:alanine dehydrogenase
LADLLILNSETIRKHLTLADAIPLVAEAFAADARGEARNFPVVRENLEEYTGIFGVKSGLLSPGEVLGFKAGGYWRENGVRYGLPGHQSVMMLFDPATGRPVCLLDANCITEVRTGAAGAVAARCLAPAGADVAAVFGAGKQGRIQIQALAAVLPLREVRVWARRPEAAEQLAAEFASAPFTVRAVHSGQAAVDGAAVVTTTTPSYEPVVQAAWIGAGTHINAMGADTSGKQELESGLLARAKLVVDNRQQALTMGESQHGSGPEAIHATLGEVLTGMKAGRERPEEITIFDSTGVTFQDLCVAGHIYRLALQHGFGQIAAL